MKTMLTSFYAKPLAVYLALALLAITTVAGPAEAMFVPSAPHPDASASSAAAADRSADLARVQAALESKVIRQKLIDYGISPENAMARVNDLSDEQINQLATHTGSLQAGGDAVGVLASLVLVALLVVLLIFLLDGRVEVR
ncbi:MAG: PA2779 family protein [Nitrospirota bacterium]